jgi:formylglycine-generating enzyme required for sulfatase activity
MAGFRSVLSLLACSAVAFLMSPIQQQTAKVDLNLVETGHGLSVMRYEVTIRQWRGCVLDGGCNYLPPLEQGTENTDFPVTGIGVLDAQEFVKWAQATIDPTLRLPTLEEWYVFSEVAPSRPNKIFTDPRMAWAATYGAGGKIDPRLKPSGGFGANRGGIADATGNVWEWTSTCVADTSPDRCPAFYAAGAHEAKVPIFVRDPSSGGCATGTPPAHLGLRLVKDRIR